MEDYIAVSEHRTPTVADALGLFPPLVETEDIELLRSMMHNDDFNRVTLYSSLNIFAKGHAYAPGVLTGLWDGQYMVRYRDTFYQQTSQIYYPLQVCPSQTAENNYSRQTATGYPDFICRRPMQCRLREHLRSYPEGMLPDANLASTSTRCSPGASRSDASNSSFIHSRFNSR